MLNRNAGYKKYHNDAIKAQVIPVSRSYFYKLNNEIGLVDSKSDGGFCLTRYRFRTETYGLLIKVLQYMNATPTVLREMKTRVNKYKDYFKRREEFYYSL